MVVQFEPIGVFRCPERYPYDAARQPEVAEGNSGTIELRAGQNFEQAIRDLEGFSRIWLVYAFHSNTGWKPVVMPPRSAHKRGVFATRAPYRPNPIGLSCVELVSVSGRRIEVGAHDLLDGTPILDIKPYIPYADSYPDAACGWLDALQEERWEIQFDEKPLAQLAWLEPYGVNCLRAFLSQQLSERPTDSSRKRVKEVAQGEWEIAYRTWRVRFRLWEETRTIRVVLVCSGYTDEEMVHEEDPYEDKRVHRAFRSAFA